MGITLWGSYADQIVNFVSKGSQGPVVIVCQFCKIKEYVGTRSLSNSMYATRILINSEVEEITQFHEGLLPEDRNTPFNLVVGRALLTTSPIEAAFSGLALSLVDLLQHSGNGDVICVIAQVLQVNKEKGWYYDACHKCQKKMELDGAIFFCHTCSKVVNTSIKRYNF
ncbi:replication protein A 70 kDa DNA-binding subunit A-like [Senna tora]|uniref:Replication protein A 70 kDa DNA-binding subunit A-like n=1 Tax=Senna tora TaxID=362788 RepID=A0A835CH24_9FABA|nr:replication protein A 70 kDa DNA-binding subunit A-like [Senna tora]